MQTLSRLRLAAAAAIPILLLTACGGGTTTSTVNATPTEGGLIQTPPPRTVSVNAADFTAQLQASADGTALLELATGDPTAKTSLPLGVDVYYIQYATVGGAGEATTASGALMVPTGPNGTSLGKLPIVLYAHGTETVKEYNMANLLAPYDDRIPTVAAVFAANGYIVVAPNYAGYDSSSLPYQCYLNAEQQSQDMIDALKAARTALASGTLFSSAPLDNGQVFITGYSQGGHVALATHRAMEAANMTVAASAPCSGPYALAAFGDAIAYGDVNFGATEFAPLLLSNFHNSYKGNAAIGDVYNVTGTAADLYEAPWATSSAIEVPGPTDLSTLIVNGQYPLSLFNGTAPSATDIKTGLGEDAWLTGTALATVSAELSGILPGITPPTTPAAEAALFATGFSSAANGHLWRNDYRVAMLADAMVNPDGLVPTQTANPFPAATPMHPLRKAFVKNDLRLNAAGTGPWAPAAPVLLIGGHNDPEVFYSVNTGIMAGLWSGLKTVNTLDIDPGISFAGLGTVAATAFGTDVAKGVVDPGTLSADINAAVDAALAAKNYTLSPTAAALQAGFLQVTGEAVATEITTANVTGIISQIVGANPPFTTAQLGANATAIATALGTATSTIILEAYHSNLVEPFAAVAALQFFQNFKN